MGTDHPLILTVAAIVAVIGTARATRLLIYDAWPPMVWVRDRFLGWAEQTRPGTTVGGIGFTPPTLTWRAGWAPLLTCPFCCAPWVALVTVATAICAHVWTPDLGTLAGWWWVLAVWASVAYAAAMVVVRDEPAEED